MVVFVAPALVSSRSDYANSVLFGCPQKPARLQHLICYSRYTALLSFLFADVYRTSQTAPLAAHRMTNQVQTCLLNLQISQRSSAIKSPRGPRVYLPVTYFQFHGTTFYLVLVLFV